MSVSIVGAGFGEKFYSYLDDCSKQLLIVSPFIGKSVASALADQLERSEGLHCTIITRFYREDFIQGVSSLFGLEQLLQSGAEIYALKDLHSKLYIFDTDSVLTGSFNFTFNGFYKNHEFGIFMDNEPAFTTECINYFNGLLSNIRATGDWQITQSLIDAEKKDVNTIIANRKGTSTYRNEKTWGAHIENNTASPTYGSSSTTGFSANNDFLEEMLIRKDNGSSTRSTNTGIWIKFEGNGNDRIPNDVVYLDRKKSLYEHRDRTFFRRRPSGIKEGDLVFMAVVSRDSRGNDTPIIIGYGESGGFKKGNEIGPDDKFFKATEGRYKYYIELRNGRYLQTPIENGISLLDLCRDLGVDLYPIPKQTPAQILSTHHQKSYIQITPYARNYLIELLDKKIL